MTHYEEIKKMSLEEMAGVLYAAVLPFIEDDPEELKREMWQSILELLRSEA